MSKNVWITCPPVPHFWIIYNKTWYNGKNANLINRLTNLGFRIFNNDSNQTLIVSHFKKTAITFFLLSVDERSEEIVVDDYYFNIKNNKKIKKLFKNSSYGVKTL